MTQAQKFLSGLGDQSYERNKNDLGKNDTVIPLLTRLGIKPRCVLEIGCADGWRLKRMRDEFGCEFTAGVDPSRRAVNAGADAGNANVLVQGVAQDLSRFSSTFDLVILGFCMWLCEPNTWFRIAAEIERLLIDGGFLIIHDFCLARPLLWQNVPEGEAYLYDFPKIWLSHPNYRQISETQSVGAVGKVQFTTTTTLLLKSSLCWEIFRHQGGLDSS